MLDIFGIPSLALDWIGHGGWETISNEYYFYCFCQCYASIDSNGSLIKL
jgi:hypothetical protein